MVSVTRKTSWLISNKKTSSIQVINRNITCFGRYNYNRSILEYLKGLSGVKAKKRHQSRYQRNQPDIDAYARVFVSGYMTDQQVLIGGCDEGNFSCEMAIAYKFEVKKSG